MAEGFMKNQCAACWISNFNTASSPLKDSLAYARHPPLPPPLSKHLLLVNFRLILTKPLMNHSLLEVLNVRVIGEGNSTLIFVHGFGTDQSTWRRILPDFIQNYRIVLYDLACSGSVNPNWFNFERYSTINGYVDDLLVIVDALHIDSCIYVGHSMSCMIGILASIRRPDLFTKLVLIVASPRFLNDEDYRGGFEQEQIDQVFSAMQSNYDEWVNGFAPSVVGSDVPTAVREFSRTLFNIRPDISLNALRTVFNSDIRGVLGSVTVPCCLIRTACDAALPVAATTYLMDHLGGLNTLEVMTNAEGHLPHVTAPEQMIHALNRALSS